MLSSKPASPQTSPFASVKTARHWLESMPKTSDYDAHHAIVEGLERFNADTRGDVINRVKVLRVMEETGLPIQARIIEQYLRNQDTLKFAKQSLWRESQMFWNHLSAAFIYLLKQTIKGDEKDRLKPWLGELTLKSLHYTAMCIRWEYYRGQRPSGLIWRRMHKIYRMAEISGVALCEMNIGNGPTSCAKEYVLALVLDLSNPPGFKPREIFMVSGMLEKLGTMPVPEIKLRRKQHTHCVDMSAPMGAVKLEDRWIQGRRLRYLELGDVIEAIENRATEAENPDERLLYQQFSRVINRGGIRRDGPRMLRKGEVRAAEGLESVLAVLSRDEHKQHLMSDWIMRDESREGLGFVIQGEVNLPIGRLAVVSHQPGEDSWKLLAIRWVRHENGKTLVGTQCLSRHPKLVRVEKETPNQKATASGDTGIFVPLADTSQGMSSNILLPIEMYSEGAKLIMRDGHVTYQLQLGEIAETHEEDWVRVGFDVLSREVADQLAA
ncbi:MAG: hypothetical protein HXY27_00090 [Hydrogenophilaceae bacterium]|nr:hypothetical protein [Hydrogenophilaceae bacterium]